MIWLNSSGKMYMSKGLGRYNNKNQLFDKHQHKKNSSYRKCYGSSVTYWCYSSQLTPFVSKLIKHQKFITIYYHSIHSCYMKLFYSFDIKKIRSARNPFFLYNFHDHKMKSKYFISSIRWHWLVNKTGLLIRWRFLGM